jgi:arginase
MLLGEGDSDFVSAVARPLRPDQVLYVGLTETTPYETDFIERRGLAHIGPEALAESAEPVMQWLRATGAGHVAVHFDLDVLDPALYDFLLFRDPSAKPEAFCGVAKGRMQWSQVVSILREVASESELVGLAITEYLPWSAIKLAQSLNEHSGCLYHSDGL